MDKGEKISSYLRNARPHRSTAAKKQRVTRGTYAVTASAAEQKDSATSAEEQKGKRPDFARKSRGAALLNLAAQQKEKAEATEAEPTNRAQQLRDKYAHLLPQEIQARSSKGKTAHVVPGKEKSPRDDEPVLGSVSASPGPPPSADASELRERADALLKGRALLPLKFRNLESTFSALDTVLGFLRTRRRSQQCAFEDLKGPVERLSRLRFSQETLAMLYTVFPEAYDIKQSLLRDSSGRSRWRLVVDFAHERGESSARTSHTIASLPESRLRARREELHNRLLQRTVRAHDKFVKQLPRKQALLYAAAGKSAKAVPTAWHSQFDLENVADIPLAILPQQPRTRKELPHWDAYRDTALAPRESVGSSSTATPGGASDPLVHDERPMLPSYAASTEEEDLSKSIHGNTSLDQNAVTGNMEASHGECEPRSPGPHSSTSKTETTSELGSAADSDVSSGHLRPELAKFSPTLLAKVRARAEAREAASNGTTEKLRRELAPLPKLVDAIRSMFRAERRQSMRFDLVIAKLHREANILDAGKSISKLSELFPGFLILSTDTTGARAVKVDPNADFPAIRRKIRNEIAKLDNEK